jgi:hypothetical protein
VGRVNCIYILSRVSFGLSRVSFSLSRVKAFWKIFKRRNFPSQHGDSAGSLIENLYSATLEEEVPLTYGKISLP